MRTLRLLIREPGRVRILRTLPLPGRELLNERWVSAAAPMPDLEPTLAANPRNGKLLASARYGHKLFRREPLEPVTGQCLE